MSGLNSIAGKLEIDCAPAMVGFDFHGGRAHPMIGEEGLFLYLGILWQNYTRPFLKLRNKSC